MSYDPYQPPRPEPSVEHSNALRASTVGLLASALIGAGVGSQVIEILAWLALDAETYASVQRIVRGIGGVARLVGVIAFLVWIYRIVARAHACGVRELKYTPGGAVALWFVPFLNLVHGYQVVSEVWKASDPKTVGAERYAWLDMARQQSDGGVILHWWLAYMASRVAIIATRVAWSPAIWALGVGVELVALTLLVVVIRRVDLRQNAYERRLPA